MIEIISKTDDYVIIYKPAGIPSQPDPGGDPDAMTICRRLLREMGEKDALYLIHRLDRVVSGLMVFARNKKSAADLSLQVSERNFRKSYFAVVQGKAEGGVMSDYIYKDPRLNKAFITDRKRAGVKNCELEIVSDAYLKECGTDNEYSEFGYTEHICTESSEDKFEARVPLSELGVEEINHIIWCEGVPRVEKCDFNGKSVEIIGEIKFSAIACQVNEDGNKLFCPIKINAPFTQNVNVSCQIYENMRLDCHSDCLGCKIEVDSNHVLASCVLSTHVTLNSQKRQRCLGSSYLTNEEYSRDESIVTVYYPDRSESLFDIAKKFHTSVSSIAESNRLTQAVFASSLEPLGSFEIKKLVIK